MATLTSMIERAQECVNIYNNLENEGYEWLNKPEQRPTVASMIPLAVERLIIERGQEVIEFFDGMSMEPKPDFSDDPDTELQQVIDDCNYWSQKLAERKQSSDAQS